MICAGGEAAEEGGDRTEAILGVTEVPDGLRTNSPRASGRVWETRGSENVTEGVREPEDLEVTEPSRWDVLEFSRERGGGRGTSVSVSEAENDPGTRKAGRRTGPGVAERGGPDTSVGERAWVPALRAVDVVDVVAGIWKNWTREGTEEDELLREEENWRRRG